MQAVPSRASDRTHKNFLEAFWQLYVSKNIDKIRVQDICTIAGYHRNSFYRYFKDVYDVREQIEDRIIGEIIQQTEKNIMQSSRDCMIEAYLAIWEQYSDYLRVFANDDNRSNFQSKLTAALKQTHRELFQYSTTDVADDYIWEYNINGSVSCMMYFFRREPAGLSLREVLALQMKFLDSNAFPMLPRKK